MDVLVLLALSPRLTVPREVLLEKVWNGRLVEEGSVARCIAEIRAVLEDDAREPRFVETIPRRGYRLIVPVSGTGGSSGIPLWRIQFPFFALSVFLAAGLIFLGRRRRSGEKRTVTARPTHQRDWPGSGSRAMDRLLRVRRGLGVRGRQDHQTDPW
ncbi:MAG: winged helix-turn-helix domain-containing protein [Acidobacteria bacterium]|nr:winged helix-turn-helix domain-containing protein [Acidobacteriota bacterium]